MNKHEETLKRQNDGYHTPLPELIERLKVGKAKIKPSYGLLDIEDSIYYLEMFLDVLNKAMERSIEKANHAFIYGDEK